MTFDRSAIMKAAWVIVRNANVARFGLRFVLRNALRQAWNDAKSAVRAARWAAEREAEAARPQTEADRIREAIWVLECKDRLYGADWQYLDQLRAELRAAQYRAAA